MIYKAIRFHNPFAFALMVDDKFNLKDEINVKPKTDTFRAHKITVLR